MKTKLWAMAVMLFVTLLTSSAQIFYKMGASKLKLDLLAIITNYHIIIGIVLYGLGAVLMILAMRGGDVSVLYPIVATSYIWVSILSQHFFGEYVNMIEWTGIMAIVVGIVFISFGSRDDSGLEYTEAV